MEKAGAFFGIPRDVFPGVNDQAEVLSKRDSKRLKEEISVFGNRFPQCGFTVVFLPLEEQFPGSTYAFWLFNKASLTDKLAAASTNRQVLLLIDTKGRRAYLTLGYGLEPFVGKQDLEESLHSARNHLVAEARQNRHRARDQCRKRNC